MIDLILLEYNHNVFLNELRDTLLEHMECESYYINRCLYQNRIILEAEMQKTEITTQKTSNDTTDINTPTKKTLSEKLKELIDKILNFFSELFNRFMGNVTKIVEINQKWLADNKNKLLNMNCNNIKVDILPYWNSNDIQSYINALSNLIDDGAKAVNTSPVTKDAVYAMLETKRLKDKNMEFKESLRKRFTVGSNEFNKKVTITGDELKNLCVNTFIPFIENFKSESIKELESQKNTIRTRIRNAKQQLKTKGFKLESYCMLEDALYKDILSCCSNYKAVLESNLELGL